MSGTLRSARWFGTHDVAGLIHRSYLRSEGITQEAIEGRPVIGVCNSWSELVNCNVHLRGLAESVKVQLVSVAADRFMAWAGWASPTADAVPSATTIAPCRARRSGLSIVVLPVSRTAFRRTRDGMLAPSM